MTDTTKGIIDWHIRNGGENVRLAGHALRLLNEAVELCVAAGATAPEITRRVNDEVVKQAQRGEFQKPVDVDDVRMELVDVQFLGDILAHHTGPVDLTAEREKKLDILNGRSWKVDEDGVLWRTS